MKRACLGSTVFILVASLVHEEVCQATLATFRFNE